jgi:hypothetical protein
MGSAFSIRDRRAMMREHGWRRSGILAAVMALALTLTGCGGGGGGTSSIGSGSTAAPVIGPAAVEISLAAAPATGSAAVPVTVAGPSTVPTPDPLYKWPNEIREPSPEIAHVYMEVVKISLMPAAEPFESEDMDGEFQDANSPDPASFPEKPHFITVVPDPAVWIDLLNLENGKPLARLLNRFDSVPTGTYDKIRVYYRKVKVVLNDPDKTKIWFHPTAHSKFDIHFRQGHELVIPFTSDTTQPDGWVKFFRVKLDVVGLKIRVVSQGKSWKGCKAILRPQIFAEAGNDILYSVAGTATIKTKTATAPVSGTFNISFGPGPRVIPVAFDNDTTWAYSDNVLGHSRWIVDVLNTSAVPAFQDNATVMAVGPFNLPELQATDIVFTFPDVKSGVVDNGWRGDNTFVLRLTQDNVVFPKPGRSTAYYDNGAFPHLPPLTQAAVDNNVQVKARGYNATGGIEAYWITVGEITVGP